MDFGDCSQKRAEVRAAQVTTSQLGAPRGERQHLPRLGIPRRSSRHKRGRAESKKRPTRPREAMARRARWAQCPPLPAVPSASSPRRPRAGRNGGRMLCPGAGARPGIRGAHSRCSEGAGHLLRLGRSLSSGSDDGRDDSGLSDCAGLKDGVQKTEMT